MRLLLTLLLLTMSMLWSIAIGSAEKWMLLALGSSWAPFVSLILVPLLTGRPMMDLAFMRRVTST